MTGREAFEMVIKENPDDKTNYLIYADWLDEHGEYEEALRMRKVPEARRWLGEFADKLNPPGFDPDDYNAAFHEYENQLRANGNDYDAVEYRDPKGREPLTVDGLIAAALGYLDSGEWYCFTGKDTPRVCRDKNKVFWDAIEVVTGRRFKAKDSWDRGHAPFTCSC